MLKMPVLDNDAALYPHPPGILFISCKSMSFLSDNNSIYPFQDHGRDIHHRTENKAHRVK